MEESCKICKRKAEADGLCVYHGTAYTNLRRAFDTWKTALGIDWRDFLTKVSENQETGEWAKEVAECLISEIGGGALDQGW